MRLFRRLLCLTQILAASFAVYGTGFGAPPATRFAGWWAVHVGGRNLIVLHLTVDKAGKVAGDLWRPAEFTLSPNTVDQIKGPIFREPVTDPRFEHEGLTFTVARPDKPAAADRMLMRVAGHGQGRLGFDVAPNLSMNLVPSPVGSKVAGDWRSTRSYTLDRATPAETDANAEMTRLFEADQSARTAGPIDWNVVGKEDEARRVATRRLLNAGALHTADDYFHAAFVFQHGATPDDFLLAHTLAMVAVNKGRQDAIWIATATLDRYLQSIGKPQIYGTQFQTRKGETTQEPYDRSLIPDSLRVELDVPSRAEQEVQRQSIQRRGG